MDRSLFALFSAASLFLAFPACAQMPPASPALSPMPVATIAPSSSPSATVTAPPTVAPTISPIAKAPLKAAYSSVNTNGKKVIAMTFDDGPSAENTGRLLDILAERKIKVTFFLVGQNAAEYPKLVAREQAEGHEVADHSWSHPQFSKMSDDAVKSQILRTRDAIESASGVRTTLIRPPYGAITARQKQWIHEQLGMNVILWSVDPQDWKYRNAAHVEAEILKQTHPGAIILSHDIHKTTVDAMPATLDALLAQGYKFVTVSELLAMDEPVPTPTPKPAASPKKAITAKKPAHPKSTP